MSDKLIDSVAVAPVVSSDTTSPEAIMAREAKKIEVQANTDSRFDTKLERFSDSSTTSMLSGLVLSAMFFLLAGLVQKRR